MMHIKTFLVFALALAAACLFSSCHAVIGVGHTAGPVVVADPPHPHQGPPPHAPAHGYRHRHSDGVELVYDEGLGVYLVAGHAGLYFSHERYYRRGDSSWLVSVRMDGGWRSVPEKSVPPGLRRPHLSKKGK